MAGPVGDYTCEDCEERGDIDGPFLNLPLKSKVCPVCGEETLRRIWMRDSAPNVNHGAGPERRVTSGPMTSSSMSKRLDHFTRSAHEEAESRRPDRPTSFRDPTVRAVPVSGLGRAMSEVMQTEVNHGHVTSALGLRGDKAKAIARSPFAHTFGSQIGSPQPIVVGSVDRGGK